MSTVIKAWMIFFGLIVVTVLAYIGLIFWDSPKFLKILLYIIAGYGTFLIVSVIIEHALKFLKTR